MILRLDPYFLLEVLTYKLMISQQQTRAKMSSLVLITIRTYMGALQSPLPPLCMIMILFSHCFPTLAFEVASTTRTLPAASLPQYGVIQTRRVRLTGPSL